ncbi:MAG TPA: SPOR domain-containing protein [Bacteroidales bacterium]|nr:SPOR domain-containing protein [Bacteroidales bacterium]HPS15800.1 SPOR domain-containing protein [Bacteroidales bacterium]
MIAQYLSELLLRFDTVVLPGLGTFQLKNVPATMSGNTIIPPGKKILFDPSLNVNDGVLANYISEKDRISFVDACSQIQNYVSNILKNLDEGNEITLEKIGILKKDDSGNLCFKADKGDIYNIDSFGLGSVSAIPLMGNTVEEKIISKKKTTHKLIWIAAIVVLFIAGFTTVYFIKPGLLKGFGINNKISKQENSNTVLNTNQNKNISENKVSTTNNKDSVITGKQDNITESPQQEGVRYYIIAASFRIKENAENYAVRLTSKGYKSESIFLPERNLYVVSYDTYTDKTQANQALASILASENSAAWILEK